MRSYEPNSETGSGRIIFILGLFDKDPHPVYFDCDEQEKKLLKLSFLSKTCQDQRRAYPDPDPKVLIQRCSKQERTKPRDQVQC